MKKHVRNFVKKALRNYCNNMYSFYKPCIESGINPFINWLLGFVYNSNVAPICDKWVLLLYKAAAKGGTTTLTPVDPDEALKQKK